MIIINKKPEDLNNNSPSSKPSSSSSSKLYCLKIVLLVTFIVLIIATGIMIFLFFPKIKDKIEKTFKIGESNSNNIQALVSEFTVSPSDLFLENDTFPFLNQNSNSKFRLQLDANTLSKCYVNGTFCSLTGAPVVQNRLSNKDYTDKLFPGLVLTGA